LNKEPGEPFWIHSRWYF